MNGFWLNSSLKISPSGQVRILARIFEGKTIYSDKSIDVLKNIMLVDDNSTQKIYGKTGSGSNGEAWFVGFSEKDGQKDYFAIYLYDSTQKEVVSGKIAKEIALEVMR